MQKESKEILHIHAKFITTKNSSYFLYLVGNSADYVLLNESIISLGKKVVNNKVDYEGIYCILHILTKCIPLIQYFSGNHRMVFCRNNANQVIDNIGNVSIPTFHDNLKMNTFIKSVNFLKI